MSKQQASFLAGVMKPASSVNRVFFNYPATKMEVEIKPIDREERLKMLDLCKIEQPIPGFRKKEVSYDEPKLDAMTSERCIGEIRGATFGCLKKLIIINPQAMREKLDLKEGEKLTDETPVPLNGDDALFLFQNSIEFKLWVDACSNRIDVYNAAQKEEELGN